MSNIDVILGLQWGDEGKGKIVDVFTSSYDVVARFQGGPNAGHTLEFEGRKHVLHTIPSGIFRENKVNIIGNGVIIDPKSFCDELKDLDNYHIDYQKQLVISYRAHLILPVHRLLDACFEQHKGEKKIGSTLKGIGPAYTDKVSRIGIRCGDMLQPGFLKRFHELTKWHYDRMESLGFNYSAVRLDGLDYKAYEEAWLTSAEEMVKRMTFDNTEQLLYSFMENDKKILAEGAQGTLLDVDFGSYPFVTSSNTISSGVCQGLGVSPKRIGEIYGVFKAYCTRVGAGPFPTELTGSIEEHLRTAGGEFGATTGRPRRCGWLDLPALRYAAMINGVTKLIMTKADVLSELDTIKVCNAYKINEQLEEVMVFRADESAQPVYYDMKGWKKPVNKIKAEEEIPCELKSYIDFIEKNIGIKLAAVSIGPDRTQIISF